MMKPLASGAERTGGHGSSICSVCLVRLQLLLCKAKRPKSLTFFACKAFVKCFSLYIHIAALLTVLFPKQTDTEQEACFFSSLNFLQLPYHHYQYLFAIVAAAVVVVRKTKNTLPQLFCLEKGKVTKAKRFFSWRVLHCTAYHVLPHWCCFIGWLLDSPGSSRQSDRILS